MMKPLGDFDDPPMEALRRIARGEYCYDQEEIDVIHAEIIRLRLLVAANADEDELESSSSELIKLYGSPTTFRVNNVPCLDAMGMIPQGNETWTQ